MTLAAASCSPDGGLCFATSTPQAAVQRLAPVPLAQQAAAAADLGEFAQALALANMMDAQNVRTQGVKHWDWLSNCTLVATALSVKAEGSSMLRVCWTCGWIFAPGTLGLHTCGSGAMGGHGLLHGWAEVVAIRIKAWDSSDTLQGSGTVLLRSPAQRPTALQAGSTSCMRQSASTLGLRLGYCMDVLLFKSWVPAPPWEQVTLAAAHLLEEAYQLRIIVHAML